MEENTLKTIMYGEFISGILFSAFAGIALKKGDIRNYTYASLVSIFKIIVAMMYYDRLKGDLL
jgi:hypothetical protein